MPLALEQRKVLISVMKDLFTSLDDLRTFIRDNTGRNVEEIATGNLATTRSGVLDHAESREWLGELVEALREVAGPQTRAQLDAVDVRAAYPPYRQAQLAALLPAARAARAMGNLSPQARRELEELGLLAPTPPTLEKIVADANSFLDLSAWLRRLTEIEACVCRIASTTPLGLEAMGTGFLVGPATVLTNHHVVADMLAGELDPKQLRVQFDHHVLRDGSTDSGTIVGLDLTSAISWNIGAAPHSPIDTTVHPIGSEPAEGELDFALLRLDTALGALPMGGAAQGATPPRRGWIDLEQQAGTAAPGSPVFIVQHPSGLPMKLSIATDGMIGYSPNKLRMRYRTNTLNGSSGSPVFNQHLQILGLHHAGDPKYPELDSGDYNEGIPTEALLRHFAQRGLQTNTAE